VTSPPEGFQSCEIVGVPIAGVLQFFDDSIAPTSYLFRD
jgi:hypothetical protein